MPSAPASEPPATDMELHSAYNTENSSDGLLRDLDSEPENPEFDQTELSQQPRVSPFPTNTSTAQGIITPDTNIRRSERQRPRPKLMPYQKAAGFVTRIAMRMLDFPGTLLSICVDDILEALCTYTRYPKYYTKKMQKYGLNDRGIVQIKRVVGLFRRLKPKIRPSVEDFILAYPLILSSVK